MKFKSIVFVSVICGTIINASAASEGVNAVVERRQTMKRIERPVRSIKQGDAILSVYEDGRLETNAVRVVKMSASTKAKVAALVDDRETLIAARALAKRVKAGKHKDKVSSLTDAEIVAAADDVLDTAARDSAASGVVGAAFALAASALLKGKNKKEKAS